MISVQPIRKGDQFQRSAGRSATFEVVGALPNGEVQLVDLARNRQIEVCHRALMGWVRVSHSPEMPKCSPEPT